ncbi:MAG: hypothetical protein Q4B01_09545 [Eubacteriales bacterium]|nr:hypothetical protein [Eubacteriales bacterium]
MCNRKNITAAWMMFCIAFMVLIGAGGEKAAAASKQYSVQFANDEKQWMTEFVETSSGAVVGSVKLLWMAPNPVIANSGKKIYFSAGIANSSLYRSNILYSYDLTTGDLRKLASLSDSYYYYDVNEVYRGSLYVSGWNGSENMALYRYDLNTGEMKKIIDQGYSSRYKKYIICESNKVTASYHTYPIYIYNTSTGNLRTVATNVGCFERSGKYLYVAAAKVKDYPVIRVPYRVFRYNLATGKKKVLAANMKGYFISKITKKYIYHSNWEDESTGYYRYNLKTKKEKKISRGAFFKATGILNKDNEQMGN